MIIFIGKIKSAKLSFSAFLVLSLFFLTSLNLASLLIPDSIGIKSPMGKGRSTLSQEKVLPEASPGGQVFELKESKSVITTKTATQSSSTQKSNSRSNNPTETSSNEPTALPITNVTSKIGRLNFANNKFGIHAYANKADLELASELINSHGGKWGWVTLTMDIHENSVDNWNSLFGKMAEKFLIPIIQLSNNGLIPSEEEIDTVSKFLASLSWPIKLRMVTPFSEVNASEYWGGKLDPEGYARILNRLIDQLKSKSGDFFVMNGAFNASARTGSNVVGCIKTDLGIDSCYLSEIEFLKRMNQAVPGIFAKLDGWAAHTYPHPSYRGKPSDTRVGAESAFEAGRNTIRSYQFELRLLRRDYGLELPVFVTETGWPHKEGKTTHSEWLDQNTVANYYLESFQKIFLPDARVVAVTPFILKRDDFDNFAFVAADGSRFPQWSFLEKIPKTAGDPPR